MGVTPPGRDLTHSRNCHELLSPTVLSLCLTFVPAGSARTRVAEVETPYARLW